MDEGWEKSAGFFVAFELALLAPGRRRLYLLAFLRAGFFLMI